MWVGVGLVGIGDVHRPQPENPFHLISGRLIFIAGITTLKLTNSYPMVAPSGGPRRGRLCRKGDARGCRFPAETASTGARAPVREGEVG